MLTFNRLLLLAGAAILAALIGGFLNALHPAFDSLSHFRLHLAVTGVSLAIILAAFRNLLGAAALGVFSVLAFGLTAGPSLLARKEALAAEGPKYRLIQANLRFDNRTPEEFLRVLARERPDVVTLQEVSVPWLPKLATVSATWPHQLVCPGTNRIGGVAILSRRPFAEGGLSICGNSGALAVQTVDFNGIHVAVASVHLKWPWPHGQAQQLDAMAASFETIRLKGDPVLIGGDLNAAPWSAAVARMAQLTSTRILPQVRGTWLLPSLPASWTRNVGLAIDNILSASLDITAAAALPAFGSDHLPILIEFTIPPAVRPKFDAGDQPVW
jgi:endonuclease/exonuclease/phosphatase (EEP) superfamily protein YafD